MDEIKVSIQNAPKKVSDLIQGLSAEAIQAVKDCIAENAKAMAEEIPDSMRAAGLHDYKGHKHHLSQSYTADLIEETPTNITYKVWASKHKKQAIVHFVENGHRISSKKKTGYVKGRAYLYPLNQKYQEKMYGNDGEIMKKISEYSKK